MSSMDSLCDSIRTSGARARLSIYRNDAPGMSLYLQQMNVDITQKIADDSPPGLLSKTDINHVTDAYIWLMRCCADSTELVDSYNGMHAAGILFCKVCYIEIFKTDRVSSPSFFFPDEPKLHICDDLVWDMAFSKCSTFLLAIQNDWACILKRCPQSCIRALLSCAAAIGNFISFHHEECVLDSIEHVQVYTLPRSAV